MIDIHAHILPLVDDGSASLEQSLQMLKGCAEQGVTDVILTPHCRAHYNESADSLRKSFGEFAKVVSENGINVNLYLGQEVFINKHVKQKLQDGEHLTLNGSKYLLLEPDYVECEITEAVYELTHIGYIPIVAHVERFPYITEQDVVEIKELGGLIQVNASALFCNDFRTDKKRAKKFLKAGLVDFVASDIHSNRENYMQKAYKYVKSKYGIKYADAVFILNAKKIIEG